MRYSQLQITPKRNRTTMFKCRPWTLLRGLRTQTHLPLRQLQHHLITQSRLNSRPSITKRLNHQQERDPTKHSPLQPFKAQSSPSGSALSAGQPSARCIETGAMDCTFGRRLFLAGTVVCLHSYVFVLQLLPWTVHCSRELPLSGL